MKKKSLICFYFFYIFINMFADNENIDILISNMTSEEKAAQVLMISIEGRTSFPVHLNSYFDGYIPGAFILFGFNFSNTPESSANYIKSVKKSMQKLSRAKKFIPPFFAADCEGGLVYRIKKIASHLPSARDVAENFNEEDALNLYTYTAIQISSLGIHLNLAPIVEKNMGKVENFLTHRLFSSNEETVVKFSKIFIDGMQSGGVLSAVKHFPGNTNIDPHISKSIIDVDEKKFYTEFINPFKNIIYNKDGVVLISHVEVPFIEKVPFCFSKKGIENILRNELKFRGLIITDDMAMNALKIDGRSTIDNVILALSAGCDMVMCSESKFKELISAVTKKINSDDIFAKRIDNAVFNILKTKIKMGIIDDNCRIIEKNKFDKERFDQAKKKAENILIKQKNK